MALRRGIFLAGVDGDEGMPKGLNALERSAFSVGKWVTGNPPVHQSTGTRPGRAPAIEIPAMFLPDHRTPGIKRARKKSLKVAMVAVVCLVFTD